MTEPIRLTEADCAYLAALIDARGRVRVRRETRRDRVYRTISLDIRPLPREVQAWLVQRFPFARVGSSDSSCGVTSVTRAAAEVCVHAYPHLLTKKAEARLVTRFVQSLSGKGARLQSDSEAIRIEVDRELYALQSKRKGLA